MHKLPGLWLIAAAIVFMAPLLASSSATAQDAPTTSAEGSGQSAEQGTPTPDAGSQDDEGPKEGFTFGGAFTSSWSPDAADKIALDDSNTLPLVIEADEPISEDYYVWDFWPLLNKDGTVAVIDGYVVIVGLAAEIDAIETPGARHGVATWRYYYRQAGDSEWIAGGSVFSEGPALGSRQWAGSAFYDPDSGEATFYYTALGQIPEVFPANPEHPDLVHQAMVSVTADVAAGEDGIAFSGFSDHETILTPDGEFYATAEQSQDMPGAHIFRDPFYFQDPATGEEYILFSATLGYEPERANGGTGLARRVDGEWRLQPPILSAVGVNSQIERPHVFMRDGLYYLFFTSHTFSFAGGLTGPEGLYGFASEDFRGNYEPLNESGLVLGNPKIAPLQTYSYIVLPGGQVLSFINYVDLGDVTLETLGEQSQEYQHDHFGGTPAPIVHIVLDGLLTRLSGVAIGEAFTPEVYGEDEPTPTPAPSEPTPQPTGTPVGSASGLPDAGLRPTDTEPVDTGPPEGQPEETDASPPAQADEGEWGIYTERYRPQVHYTRPFGWMNDPNGLVFVNGTWNLYYQANPLGRDFGAISWGHAVSEDLLRWQPVGLAIPFDGEKLVFSGSAVVDSDNTSGLCMPSSIANDECVVAIYTVRDPTETGVVQHQNIAVSQEGGVNLMEFDGNPVLDIGSSDFRDPKVFWHEPTSRWIMVIAKPIEHRIAIYGSPNLHQWEHLSDFGPSGSTAGIWECPDLIEMPVEGEDASRWVMVVSMNPGHVAGGSGAQYFVGDFDGREFTPAEGAGANNPLWVDWGKDFYCSTTFANAPDGAHRWIGWMSDWLYASETPTYPWRGQMTLPRDLSLVSTPDGPRLAQHPVEGMTSLRQEAVTAQGGATEIAAALDVVDGRSAWELQLNIAGGTEGTTTLAFTQEGAPPYAVLRYDAATRTLTLDRTGDGNADVGPAFPDSFPAPVAGDGPINLRVIVDRSSIEVFTADGRTVLTSVFFPTAEPSGIDVTADEGIVLDATLWRLRSVWR